MKLQETFYTIKQLTFAENQLIANIEINANDAIFDGHFPNNPVTPGVAQLEIIKEILSEHYERSVILKSISNCKYLAILDPRKNPMVTISLSITEVENDIKVNANFAAEGTVFTKVSGVYA